jgi:hypothetical protein
MRLYYAHLLDSMVHKCVHEKKALSHCIRMLMHYCSVSRVITSLRFSGFQKLVPSQDAVVRLPRLVAVPAETGAQGLPERL